MSAQSANELVGQLTLADAMLGEIVTDLRRILAIANWPGDPTDPDVGLTTYKAVGKLQKTLRDEAALDSPALAAWIKEVELITDARDRLVHAIALDQCMKCGDATMFRHPRSGEDVDRSPEAVARVKTTYDRLISQGLPVASALAEAVNERIAREAKRIANETNEVQGPPQIHPHHVEHLCPPCAGGVGQTVVHLGTALAVFPDAQFEELKARIRQPR